MKQASPIRALRKRLGLRQIDLAQRAGMAQAAISQAEHGHIPLATTAIRIARALGTDVESLFGAEVDERDAGPVLVRDGFDQRAQEGG